MCTHECKNLTMCTHTLLLKWERLLEKWRGVKVIRSEWLNYDLILSAFHFLLPNYLQTYSYLNLLHKRNIVKAYLSPDLIKASSYNFVLVQKNITCRIIDFYIWIYSVILKLKWKDSVQQPTLKQKQSCSKDSHWLKHMKDYHMRQGGSSLPHSALNPFWSPKHCCPNKCFTPKFLGQYKFVCKKGKVLLGEK